MTAIASLLDQDVIDRLNAAADERVKQQALVAQIDVNEPAKIVPYDTDYTIHVLMPCAHCKAEVQVPPDLPEGLEHSQVITICADCAPSYVKNNPVTYVRNADPERPLLVTTKNKEKPVYDLDTMTDAELGAKVRARILEQRAAALPAKVEKAKKERVKAEKKAKKGVKATQKARKVVKSEITVSASLTVPALDLSEVSSHDEVVPATLRSPYNKARFRLKLTDEALDPETTTYADLIRYHDEILAAVQAKVATKVQKQSKSKDKKVALVAEVSTDDSAKVDALASTLGISKKKARKMLASL